MNSPKDTSHFLCCYEDITERLTQIDPVRYDKTRNYLNGDVTWLSPFITHGIISTVDIAEAVQIKYSAILNANTGIHAIDNELRNLTKHGFMITMGACGRLPYVATWATLIGELPQGGCVKAFKSFSQFWKQVKPS